MALYTDQPQQGLDEYMVLICMMYAHIYVAALVYMILCVYMRDWIITSGYDSSPPPVNLQSPLIPSCCRESSSSSKLSRSDDAGCNNPSSYCPSFMYIFVSLDDVAGFILYRIDALHHLQHNINSPHDLNNLDPLLFFPSTTGPDMQPAFFNCIKFGSKFYFFGLDHYFGANDSTNCNVYTIEEKDLKAIKPGLHNDIHNFQSLFSKTKNPMHGPKYSPFLFVANQKLFVLSQDVGSECIFEVFSPSDETWQPLPLPSDNPLGNVASLLVLKEQEQLIYFSVGDYILSFNLETHKWITPPHYRDIFIDDYFDDYLDTSSSHPPTFRDKPVSIIGDMAFGFRHHPYIAKGNYICASQSTTSGGEELMQPNLAPDQAFLEVLRSSRFAYMDKHELSYSDSLVALQDSDGKQVMCIVTYGIKPRDKTNFHVCTRTAYVALSFFDIPGDFYTLKDSPVQEHDVEMDASYADQKAEDGTVFRRYFTAKFRHTTHFVINDSNMFPRGELVSCFT